MQRRILVLVLVIPACNIGTPGETNAGVSLGGNSEANPGSTSAVAATDSSGFTDSNSSSGSISSSTMAATGEGEPLCPASLGAIYAAKGYDNPGNELSSDVQVIGDSLWALFYTKMCNGAPYGLDFGLPTGTVETDAEDDIILMRYDLGLGPGLMQAFGGPGNQAAEDLATDASGRLYIAGYFTEQLNIPSQLGDETPMFVHAWTATKRVGFVAAFEPDGQYAGARDIRSLGGEISLYGIDVSSAGVAITGSYTGTLDDPAAKSGCGYVPIDDAGAAMVFTSRLSFDNGKVESVWTQCASNVLLGGSMGFRVAIDDAANTYTVGQFAGEIAFGDANVPDTHAAGVDDGDYDGFVASWDPQGEHRWHLTCGSDVNDGVYDVDLGADSRVVVAGRIGDKQHCSESGLVPGSTAVRGFVAGIDDSGVQPKWSFDRALTLDLAEASASEFWSVEVAGNGSCEEIVVAGFAREKCLWESGFDPDAQFGDVEPFGASDVIVAKLRSDGSSLWERRIGSSGVDSGYGVAVDAAGSVYVGGYYANGIDDGLPQPWPSTPPLCQPQGFNNAFILHLSP